MATARKLPSGNWRVLIYSGKDGAGKRTYKSFTASTKKEAELMGAQWATKQGSKKASDMTVKEAVEIYIQSKSNILSASTVREYEKIKNTAFIKLMKVKLKDIDNNILQQSVNDEFVGISSKTIKNKFGLVSSAIREQMPDFAVRVKYPPKAKKEIAVPSTKEIQKLMQHVKDTPMEIPIALAVFGGLRRGEIAALDNVDEKNKTITINKVLVENDNKEWILQDRAKTEAGNRKVNLPDFVIDILVKKCDNELPLVELSPNAMSMSFQRIKKKMGLNFRFHDLRHYYASVLMSMGIPDKYVMERIGHATDNMLKTVYQHTMQEKQKEIDDKINSYFSDMQHEMQHK